MRRAALSAAAVVLWTLLTAGSCATTTGPAVQRVEVPIIVQCADKAPAEPSYVDTGKALKETPKLFGKAQLLLAGRAQRDAYIHDLKASRAGCD